MVTYSDVADDEDSGVFIVGDLGVAIGMRQTVQRPDRLLNLRQRSMASLSLIFAVFASTVDIRRPLHQGRPPSGGLTAFRRSVTPLDRCWIAVRGLGLLYYPAIICSSCRLNSPILGKSALHVSRVNKCSQFDKL